MNAHHISHQFVTSLTSLYSSKTAISLVISVIYPPRCYLKLNTVGSMVGCPLQKKGGKKHKGWDSRKCFLNLNRDTRQHEDRAPSTETGAISLQHRCTVLQFQSSESISEIITLDSKVNHAQRRVRVWKDGRRFYGRGNQCLLNLSLTHFGVLHLCTTMLWLSWV